MGATLPCQVLDIAQDTVDCPKANLKRVVLNLGNMDDVASVSGNVSLPVIFQGGAGNDGLFGGGGFDIFFGDAGNDNIVARDGRPETIDCGEGDDTAISDDADTRISCEQIEGTPTATACAARRTATTRTPLSIPASSTSPTTGSTRTARAPPRRRPRPADRRRREPARRGRRAADDLDGRPLPPAPRTPVCTAVGQTFRLRVHIDGAWYRCCGGRVRKLVDCCAPTRRRINGDGALRGYCYDDRKVFCVMYFQTSVPC